MRFRDLIGQTELSARIHKLIDENHLPHAIMLSSHEGSGGMPMALAIAQYLVCTQPHDGDACGECSGCSKMQKLQHPDVHFSFPVYRKDKIDRPPVSDDFITEFREFLLQQPYASDVDWFQYLDTNKQGNISAAECRAMLRKLQLRSFESRTKVMIIWYPEYLENEGNILLKMIEEPTDHTLILFVSSDIEAVLPTILSRTQIFALKRLDTATIQQALEQKGIDSDKALLLARLSEGNMQKALNLMSQGEDDIVNQLSSWFEAIFSNQGLLISDWCTDMASQSKEVQKKFLEYTIQLIEHLIRYRYLGADKTLFLDRERQIIQQLQARNLHDNRLAAITKDVNESIYEIERNANTKILFHSLSLRIQKLVQPSAMAV